MKEKTKVLSYVFRMKDNAREVLVFRHRDFLEAGIQVVGGTVDPGEEFIPALVREIHEESGLIILSSECFFLGQSRYQRKEPVEINLRHYYEVKISGLPDSWSHTVFSEGADNGMVFEFFWMPTALAKSVLVGEMGELLEG